MKPIIGAAFSICGALFIGYCIYFDRWRRRQPDFRKNLRLRREKEKSESRSSFFDGFCEGSEQRLKDAFMHEIIQGQQLLMAGDFEGGIDHLARSVLICNRPIQLIQIFQQALPINLSTILMKRVQAMQIDLMPPQQFSSEDLTYRYSQD